MSIALVVAHPFASYAKGDSITDAATIKLLLETNPHQVRAVAVPDPSPAPASQPSVPSDAHASDASEEH